MKGDGASTHRGRLVVQARQTLADRENELAAIEQASDQVTAKLGGPCAVMLKAVTTAINRRDHAASRLEKMLKAS